MGSLRKSSWTRWGTEEIIGYHVAQLRKGTIACQVAVGATVNACAAHAWYWGLAALSAQAGVDMYIHIFPSRILWL